jgi:membrane dipeptidase
MTDFWRRLGLSTFQRSSDGSFRIDAFGLGPYRNGRSRLEPSRRELLALMAGATGALFAPRALFADELDPRVAKIVVGNIAVDMHNHVTVTFVKDGEADQKTIPPVALASEMKRAGFAALCYTYAVDHVANTKPGDFYKFHMQALDQVDRLLAQQKMSRALTLKDLQTAHTHGRPAIIQASEGAQYLEGHLERAEEAYRRGLRLMQLVHHVNDLASPLGDIQTGPPNELGGLTPFGAQVVKECNRLHILMDLAHAAFPMVKGVLAATTQPIIISHTALDTPHGRAGKPASLQRRLVSREHARAVADAGGIVGVWQNFATVSDFVTGVKEMVDAVGIEHVGIGTDTSMGSKAIPGEERPTNAAWPEQQSGPQGGFVYVAVDEMLKQGFAANDIGKIIGGNFCRVFGKVMQA